MPNRQSARLRWTFLLLGGSALLLVALVALLPRATQAPPDNPWALPADNHVTQQPRAPVDAAPPIAPREDPSPGDAAPAGAASSPLATATRPAAAPSRETGGAIAVVLDDAGQNLRDLEPFLSIPARLSIAVLPHLPYSAEAARLARESGKDVLLHCPMEPVGDADPGPGAILTGRSEAQIREALESALASVGGVDGINNHMGSRATADWPTMEAVLSFTRERGLLFLDSRTSAESVSSAMSEQTGAVVLERDAFLDNDTSMRAMQAAMEQGMRLARSRGYAVLIGHVHTPGLADLLRRATGELESEGYSLVGLREIQRIRDQGVAP